MNALKGAAGRSWRAVPMPKQIARLPRDRRGYPVPAVAGVNADSSPNLSELESMAATRCHRQRRCSTCGEKLAPGERTFICDPDYTCAEPPMHEECAHYALRACPHLAGPKSTPAVVVTALRYRRCPRPPSSARYRPASPFLRWNGGATARRSPTATKSGGSPGVANSLTFSPTGAG